VVPQITCPVAADDIAEHIVDKQPDQGVVRPDLLRQRSGSGQRFFRPQALDVDQADVVQVEAAFGIVIEDKGLFEPSRFDQKIELLRVQVTFKCVCPARLGDLQLIGDNPDRNRPAVARA